MGAGNSVAILNIGRTKTGKTTKCKDMLHKFDKSLNVHIYDVNNEYSEFYKEVFLPYEDFMLKIKEERNSVILFEEATIFFSTRGCDKMITEFLVRKRHTNNYIILNFHSFSSVPKNIFNLVDFVTIFKTNDTVKNVKDRFDNEKLLNAFEEVRKSDNNYFNKTISLY